MKQRRILLLPGDGIGPEVTAEAERVLQAAAQRFGLNLLLERALLGGAALDEAGVPLPEDTLRSARAAEGILLGAVGGPRWDDVSQKLRPEQGLLQLRSALGLFANLRPAVLNPALAGASTLKPEVVEGLDLLIVRELIGGIYFGQPRGVDEEAGERRGFNTMVYRESEIQRIGRKAFELAQKRSGRLCSVDKANVLEVTALWREVMEDLAAEYPEVSLSHMYVDNAAMQLVRAPKQFDVIVTGNLFGDILSDAAAMLTGSIGMLPSAALGEGGRGLYEPCHGSAPDIAGQGLANPLAAILSAAMLLRHSLGAAAAATAVEQAVAAVLAQGLRTPDIAAPRGKTVGTEEMGQAVAQALSAGDGDG